MKLCCVALSALAMSCCCIWSMHFSKLLPTYSNVSLVGTICFTLNIVINGVLTPLPTQYDILLTIMSAVVAFVLCFVGFSVTTIQIFIPQIRKLKVLNLLQDKYKVPEPDIEDLEERKGVDFKNLLPTKNAMLTWLEGDKFKPHIIQIFIGALFCAAGVASMHYMGMYGTVVQNAHMHFSGGLVFLSVVIAIVASFAALWIAFNVEKEHFQAISAIVAGIAVCGMHYTGIFAATWRYEPGSTAVIPSSLSSFDLILIVTLATTLTCFVMLMISSITRRSRYRAEKRMDLLNQAMKKRQVETLDNLVSRIASEEYQTRRVMDLVSDAICIIDHEGDIIKANSAFDRLIGINPDSSRGNIVTYIDDVPEIIKLSRKSTQKYGHYNGHIQNKLLGSISVAITASMETNLEEIFCVLILRKSVPELPLHSELGQDSITSSVTETDMNTPHHQHSWYFSQLYELRNKMEDSDFLNEFSSFTKKEFSEENIEFIMQVKQYKQCQVVIERIQSQERILNMFVKIGASKQLNLPGYILEAEYRDIMSGFGQVDIFDRLEKKVLEILLDSYVRFKQAQK
jgi:NO-binding membrane sensor protein with MHYT domain